MKMPIIKDRCQHWELPEAKNILFDVSSETKHTHTHIIYIYLLICSSDQDSGHWHAYKNLKKLFFFSSSCLYSNLLE